MPRIPHNKLTIQDCAIIAKNNGGKCLSTEYSNYSSKIKWSCSKGHVWMASLASVKSDGVWCRAGDCVKSGQVPRMNWIEEAQQLASVRGGKCISLKYKSMHVKMTWECAAGHIFLMGLSKIRHRNQWCPHCCPRPPLSVDTCHAEAAMRGGRFLGDTYTNCEIPIPWECSNGHHWHACLSSIRNGDSWCPRCKTNKSQNKLTKILEGILKLEATVNYRGHEWLRNPDTDRKLEIDIWFPQIKLAVEYDGRQHFVAIECFGGEKNLNEIVHRDSIKNSLINNHDDVSHFIRVSYKDKLTVDDIKNRLLSEGIIC